MDSLVTSSSEMGSAGGGPGACPPQEASSRAFQGVVVPRARIALAEEVEYLSILDEQANVDVALDPRLPPHELQRLYRTLLLGRRFDERMIMLSRQGRIGNYPPYRGQEAASLGPAWVLRRDDWIVPSFRELIALIHHGWPMHRLILGWWGGHEIGAQPPEGVNALPLCGPVAGQCLHAAGLAWGSKLAGRDAVAVCFIGDGGTSEGDFHEAMNVAGVFRLPLIMIVQNNHWAISTPRSRQTASATFVQKAVGYGVPAVQVDGNDILAMIVATRAAVDRARAGGGATLIEAVTYRLGPHSTSDDPKKYRNPAEVEPWEKREPLIRFRKYMEARGLLTDATQALIEAEIDAQIVAEIALAEQYRPVETEPFDHCFAEMPDHLVRQRAEFEHYLRVRGGGAAPAPAAAIPSAPPRLPVDRFTPTVPVV